MPTPDTTKKPETQLPSIFPPKLHELKELTSKKANKAINKLVRQPILPKALQKKNESQELIERIKS